MKANRISVTRKLNIARGQLNAISEMVESNQYCVDISTQILATISLLKRINQEILTAHISSCVKNASGDELDSKLEEITSLFKRID